MKPIVILMLGVMALAAGCASAPPRDAHVLSGEAPVEKIIEKGDAAAVAGDYRAAALLYKQAINQQPSAEAWYRLGMAEIYLEEPERAAWAFRKALELDPEHMDSLQRMALYHTTNGHVLDATTYLERLLMIDDGNWQTHNALGVLADLEQRFDDAADHYTTAVKLNAGSAMLWNNLGYSCYLAGDYDLAGAYFEHALQIDSTYRTARNNLALLFARQAQYDEALKILVAAGDESAAYLDIGYLAYRMGDFARAEALLTEAIRRSPSYNAQAYRSLAEVREARRAAAEAG